MDPNDPSSVQMQFVCEMSIFGPPRTLDLMWSGIRISVNDIEYEIEQK